MSSSKTASAYVLHVLFCQKAICFIIIEKACIHCIQGTYFGTFSGTSFTPMWYPFFTKRVSSLFGVVKKLILRYVEVKDNEKELVSSDCYDSLCIDVRGAF